MVFSKKHNFYSSYVLYSNNFDKIVVFCCFFFFTEKRFYIRRKLVKLGMLTDDYLSLERLVHLNIFNSTHQSKVKENGHTNMYLQAVWQLSDRLLQEESHKQEVELRNIRVFGQQRLQNRETWEMAGVLVDLPHCGPSTGTAADVEA